MKIGRQTWKFETKPVIQSTGTVVGPEEGNGPLGKDFDIVHQNPYLGQDSWEKAERMLLEQAIQICCQKGRCDTSEVDFMIAGDLLNQIVSSNYAARTMQIPMLGIFAACATSTEGLALAAQLVDSGAANKVITGTVSHYSTAEKQFRYPLEYGGQKPPTSHLTATAAGVALVGPSTEEKESSLYVTYATIGKVVDMGIANAFEMGPAMAPAAADTIEAHFRETGRTPEDYDLIVTGDLARVGHPIAIELLHRSGIEMGDRFGDCGMMLYYHDQPEVFSGGSGTACSAIVAYGHIANRMKRGELRRVLVVATGALFSPLTTQQNETIPCIAHAVAIETLADGPLEGSANA